MFGTKGSIWLATIGVVGLTAGFEGTSVMDHFASVRTPMTIEYSIQDGSGAPKANIGYTMYYRGDGASVLENRRTSFPHGDFSPTRLIFLPQQKTVMNLDPESNSVYTFVMKPMEIRGSLRRPERSDSKSACMHELIALLGPGEDRSCEPTDDRILGFRVWRTRAQVHALDRTITNETYLAPALNWHLLRQDSIESKKVVGRIIAGKVVLGEPPDVMFRAPRGAKVSTVFDFGKAWREIRGLERCESCEESDKQEDKHRVNLTPPIY